jgi:hypothetical protein
MSEGKSSMGPAVLVFGCLGLLVLSLMVAAVGMAMIVFRGVAEASPERVHVGPMDPGLPQPYTPTPMALPAPSSAEPPPAPVAQPLEPAPAVPAPETGRSRSSRRRPARPPSARWSRA